MDVHLGGAEGFTLAPGEMLPRTLPPGEQSVQTHSPARTCERWISSLYGQARGEIGEYSNRPGRTLRCRPACFHNMDPGGGQWGWMFTGGSYTMLPKTVPPDDRTAIFLMAEGVLGLV
ncbi:hypothetical protein G7Y79_00018g044530 [Physcia stellaris]|nr:hypothetical protein G7Y79_00018g044530 [Physcia stellaris]